LHTMFNDAYRVMAYLYGTDKAETAGMSREAAENAGLELSRKVVMDWTSMTPIEQSIMRSVFPFYGLMRHVVGYGLRYPIDHPFRAEMLTQLGRIEMQDAGDSLPTKFLSSLFLGGMTRTGGQNALDLHQINPMTDLMHIMTLGGMVGSMNPVIS